jgi:hypothetical protein
MGVSDVQQGHCCWVGVDSTLVDVEPATGCQEAVTWVREAS